MLWSFLPHESMSILHVVNLAVRGVNPKSHLVKQELVSLECACHLVVLSAASAVGESAESDEKSNKC